MPASLKKKKISLKYVAVHLILKKGNPYKLGFVTAFPMCSVSVGKLDEKPLVLLCGCAMPCSCAWSRVSNTEAPVVLRSQLGVSGWFPSWHLLRTFAQKSLWPVGQLKN